MKRTINVKKQGNLYGITFNSGDGACFIIALEAQEVFNFLSKLSDVVMENVENDGTLETNTNARRHED